MPVSPALELVGGAVVGSAAGTAAVRWPDGALCHPRRSTCAGCGRTVRARDLVPVVAWLRLRGRCRDCAAPIDARLPAIEISSALLAVLLIGVHGGTRGVALSAGAIALLVAATVDLRHRVVPDRLTLPLAAGALAAFPVVVGNASRPQVLAWALGAPLVLQALVLVARAVDSPRPIGGGDIKLLVGVLLLAGAVDGGPPAVLLGATVIGGVVASLGLVSGRLGRTSRLPFAPAIAAAYLLVVLVPGAAEALLAPFGGVR